MNGNDGGPPAGFAGKQLTALQATAEDPDPDWLAEFEAAARRPLALRWRYAFIHICKPVLDDAGYRSFDTMEEYRRWCEDHLPEWLGYGRVGLAGDDLVLRAHGPRILRRLPGSW